MREAITAERLRELIHYDPETGAMTRLKDALTGRPNRITAHAGDVFGCLRPDGYLVGRLDGRLYRVSRLAWLSMTGQHPTMKIDHMDGVRSNNKWGNLRDVSQLMNVQNQRAAPSHSTSGLLGATYHKAAGRWMAYIKQGRKQVYLGLHDTAALAHAAYLAAKRELHAGCTI